MIYQAQRSNFCIINKKRVGHEKQWQLERKGIVLIN